MVGLLFLLLLTLRKFLAVRNVCVGTCLLVGYKILCSQIRVCVLLFLKVWNIFFFLSPPTPPGFVSRSLEERKKKISSVRVEGISLREF